MRPDADPGSRPGWPDAAEPGRPGPRTLPERRALREPEPGPAEPRGGVRRAWGHRRRELPVLRVPELLRPALPVPARRVPAWARRA